MTQDQVMTEMWKSLLDDRKAERRRTYLKYAILGTIGLLYGAAFLATQLNSSGESATPGKYVNVVRVEGTIAPGESASAESLNPLLARAFSDVNAEGVVLLINSPGGTPVQSSLIHDTILRLKAKHQKKVIAVGEDMVTSGAYFIAVAADEIVVNRSTVAGSIGVVSRGFGFTGLMERIGVERRVQSAGASKNLGDSFGPQTEESLAKQTELLGNIHNHFMDVVKQGRGDRLNLDSPGLFSGTVWTGEQALEMGLVDKLGDLHTATEAAFGSITLKEIKPAKTLLDMAIGGIGVEVGRVLVPKVQAPASLTP